MKITACSLLLITVQLACSVATAEETPLQQALKRKISFELDDVCAEQALNTIASLANVSIILHPHTTLERYPVTLSAKEITLENALAQINAQTKFNEQRTDDAIYYYLKDAGEMPRAFAPSAPWEEALRQKLQKKVTLKIEDQPWQAAITELAEKVGASVIMDAPRNLKLPSPRLNFCVHDLSAEKTLMWLMRCYNLDYLVRDEALFIHSKGLYSREHMAMTTAMLEKAVKELSADEYAVRQQASEFINQYGPSARKRLTTELKTNRDPEVQVRLNQILDKMDVFSPFDDEPAELSAVLNKLKHKRVFTMSDSTIQDVLVFMQSNSETRFKFEIKDLKSSRITMFVSDMEAGNTIRWMSRLSRHQLSIHDGTLTVDVIPEPQKTPDTQVSKWGGPE